jgi:hypothetical protein
MHASISQLVREARESMSQECGVDLRETAAARAFGMAYPGQGTGRRASHTPDSGHDDGDGSLETDPDATCRNQPAGSPVSSNHDKDDVGMYGQQTRIVASTRLQMDRLLASLKGEITRLTESRADHAQILICSTDDQGASEHTRGAATELGFGGALGKRIAHGPRPRGRKPRREQQHQGKAVWGDEAANHQQQPQQESTVPLVADAPVRRPRKHLPSTAQMLQIERETLYRVLEKTDDYLRFPPIRQAQKLSTVEIVQSPRRTSSVAQLENEERHVGDHRTQRTTADDRNSSGKKEHRTRVLV